MSNSHQRIVALDVHGGDFGPSVLVPAAADAVQADADLQVLLAGLEQEVQPLLDELPAGPWRERLVLAPCAAALEPDASPRAIMRRGSDTSLWHAVAQVAAGRAGAAVSAASTTALMTVGVKLLGQLPGIKRPALMASIPRPNGVTGLLDLGANLQVDALQLVQFAMMGSVVAQQAGAPALPRVALLNVGHEETKGHAIVREAHELMRNTRLNYVGYIEGHDLFEGEVDVAVCDGFAGNLILKASEGLASMLFGEVRNTLAGNWRSKLGAWLAAPALKAMVERLDPAKHNGAPLLGLNGVVVKSHGRSGRQASTAAILEAGREIERQVPQRIATMVSDFDKERIQ